MALVEFTEEEHLPHNPVMHDKRGMQSATNTAIQYYSRPSREDNRKAVVMIGQPRGDVHTCKSASNRVLISVKTDQNVLTVKTSFPVVAPFSRRQQCSGNSSSSSCQLNLAAARRIGRRRATSGKFKYVRARNRKQLR